MPESTEDFSFEEDCHVYRAAKGHMRPSVTQALSLAGIFDFSMVRREVLEWKRQLGKNVHTCTAEFDLAGELDLTWLLPEGVPYYRAWLKFLDDTRCKIVKVEQPMMRKVHGIEVGGTPDRELIYRGRRYIADLKCCATKHPGWRLQTGTYELMETGRPFLGNMGRMSVLLKPNGMYDLSTYEDASDYHACVAAVIIADCADRMDPRFEHAADVVRIWKKNVGLKETVCN